MALEEAKALEEGAGGGGGGVKQGMQTGIFYATGFN